MTPCALLIILLVRRGLRPSWREAAMSATPVLAMFTACMILLRTPAPGASYDMFVIGLIFTASNIVLRLRFVHALVGSVLAVAMAMATGSLHPDVPPDALRFAFGLLAGAAVFTVMAARQAELGTRQNYLLLLRETLRSQAAQRSASAFARLSHTDPLTRLANRRAFDAALTDAWQAAGEEHWPLALLLVDIDHFKQYNDRHGHPAGDRCLQQVAAGLAAAVREGDLVARLGGEEFGVLLSTCSCAQARTAAERLRQAVERQALPHGGLPTQPCVTVSLGLALAVPGQDTEPASLVDRADIALYQAKRDGRNRWAEAA
jgi:diguanylate cyclase (GGDEF)-like protein